jgi:hypothetical protein
VHVGTGNYHPVTARIYTDLSYFTSDPIIARDVARVFNYITGYAEPSRLERMAVSPLTLRKRIHEHIEEETAHAKAGRPAAIWMKMNRWSIPISSTRSIGLRAPACRSNWWCAASAACGRAFRAFPRTSASNPSSAASSNTAASTASAPVTACRIAKAAVYISSADMMPRNLDRRVEVLCPILNPTVHEQVLDQIMVANLKDNEQSWQLLPTARRRASSPRGRGECSTLHTYFMTNPSLSGRGKSPKESIPRLRHRSGADVSESRWNGVLASATRIAPQRSENFRRQMSRAKIDAQGRLDHGPPLAVIDIGSNSVRLVVYEGLTRSPTANCSTRRRCAALAARCSPPGCWPRTPSSTLCRHSSATARCVRPWA